MGRTDQGTEELAQAPVIGPATGLDDGPKLGQRVAPRVNLIAAVGRRGQLGLDGRMPWHDSEDLGFFKLMTTGAAIIVGPKTFEKLPPLPGRTVIVDDRDMTPEFILESIVEAGQIQVWVAGGANTYRRWMHLVRRSFITHVDYDGPADVFMPPLY